MNELRAVPRGHRKRAHPTWLADTLWHISEGWGDYARECIGLPLTRAFDQIGLQLALTQGRSTLKQHMQRITNARKALAPADYYLQRAFKRGLIETVQIEQIRAQMIALAQRLDQHAQEVVAAANQKIAEQKKQQEKKERLAQVEPTLEVKADGSVAH